MTANPTVSVIVPAYNAERTIGETMESVLAQSMGDLELLIIDDGSTDGTLRVAESWQARDVARVRILQHPSGKNCGVAASRNLALDHAQGEFIAFLDADDAWLPHKLEVQLRAFEIAAAHVGVVFSDAWNSPAEPGQRLELGESWRHPHSPQLGDLFRGVPGTTAEHLLFSPDTEFYNWVMSPTPLVRATCFRQGLRFIGPPRLNTQFEDYLMWLMLSLQCEFLAIPEPLAHYRIHESQFVSRYCREARCLQYLVAKHELLIVLCEECQPEIERRGWTNRIQARFRAVSLRSLATYSPATTSAIRSVPLRDYAGLLRLAIQTENFVATSRVLALRSWRVLWAELRRSSIARALKHVIRRPSVG